MADDPSAGMGIIPEPGYPPQEVVTLYADGVTSFTPGQQTIRFHLARMESNFVATEPSKLVVVGQIIMPLASFLHTAKFFESIVSSLLSNGTLTQDQIDEMLAGTAFARKSQNE
jgi:hypothetical protein